MLKIHLHKAVVAGAQMLKVESHVRGSRTTSACAENTQGRCAKAEVRVHVKNCQSSAKKRWNTDVPMDRISLKPRKYKEWQSTWRSEKNISICVEDLLKWHNKNVRKPEKYSILQKHAIAAWNTEKITFQWWEPIRIVSGRVYACGDVSCPPLLTF